MISRASEQNRQFKRRFKIYYISKSTAWITPIFFLFLQNQVGLSIESVLQISGLLMVLPIVMDAPLGLLADRIGAKKLLVGGTFFQFVSLLGFFALPAVLSYLAYLLSIIVAENCYSGAEQSFLSENLTDETEIRTFLKELNKSFYYATIPALLGGIALYHLNPHLPLAVQALSFLAALVAIVGFPTHGRNASGPVGSANPLNLIENFKFVLGHSGAVATLLIGIAFASVVQINSKTIQGQLQQLAQDQLVFWLSLSYVIGNLISGSALTLWQRTPLEKSSFQKQILVLFALLFVSQVTTASANVMALSSGFLLLNAVKSVYRPLLAGEQIAQLRAFPGLAANLSVLSTSATVALGGLHVLNSKLISEFSLGNLPLVFILSALIGIALVMQKAQATSWLPLRVPSSSGKRNWIGLHRGIKAVRQTYPTGSYIPQAGEIKPIAANLGVRTPQILMRDDHHLISEFVDGSSLAEMPARRQEEVVSEFVARLSVLKQVENRALADSSDLAGSDFLAFLRSRGQYELAAYLSDPRFIASLHGDLNPHNLLVLGDEVTLLDWDLCGDGYLWFDALSLITHPALGLGDDARVSLLSRCLVLDAEKISTVIGAFCEYKVDLLTSLDRATLASTIAGYQSLKERTHGHASA